MQVLAKQSVAWPRASMWIDSRPRDNRADIGAS